MLPACSELSYFYSFYEIVIKAQKNLFGSLSTRLGIWLGKGNGE